MTMEMEENLLLLSLLSKEKLIMMPKTSINKGLRANAHFAGFEFIQVTKCGYHAFEALYIR